MTTTQLPSSSQGATVDSSGRAARSARATGGKGKLVRRDGSPAATYTVEIMGYDRPPLSLNDRKHWAVVAKERKDLKWAGQASCAHARLPRRLGKVSVTLHYQPETKRKRDLDNMAASVKPLIDAMVAYGSISSDDSETVTQVAFRVHDKASKGRLWLTVEVVA